MKKKEWGYAGDMLGDLQRENAQLKAVIAEQKSVIDNDRELFDVPAYTKQLEKKLEEQSLLIEKLADSLGETNYFEALQQYEQWKESK